MKQLWNKYLHQCLLLVMMLLIAVLLTARSEHFLTWRNLKNILEANTYRLILALGMTVVIASGVMDLSAGAMLSLSGIVMALLLHMGISPRAAVLLGLLTGGAMGFVNGWMIQTTNINFFILTLGTSTIYRGIALTLTGGKPISRFPAEFMWFGTGKWCGIQISIWVCLLLVLAVQLVMQHTTWGSYIQSLGSSRDSLSKVGVSVGRYRIAVHIFMGIMAAAAAVIITARLNSAEPNAGIGMELDAVTAAILGGTPVSGGRVSIIGTVLAVLLLGLVRNGLTLLSVSSNFQQLITGIIFIASIVFSEIKARKH